MPYQPLANSIAWWNPSVSKLGQKKPPAVVSHDWATWFHSGTPTSKRRCAFTATSGGIGATPVVVDDLVLIGSFDGKVYAIDAATGKLRWVFEGATGWFWAQVAVDGDTVYAPSFDGRVYALDLQTGEEASAWAGPFDAKDLMKASPSIVDGVLVVATENGLVIGIDLSSGEEKWSTDLESKIFAPLVSVGGTVYVNAQDNRLYALDGETGAEEWSVGLGD